MQENSKQKTNNSTRRKNRELAVQYIYAWEANRPVNLSSSILSFFEISDCEPETCTFADKLIHGIVENNDVIDQQIKEHAQNWTFNRIGKMDLAILRLAIYELLYRTDIPPIVSINEAIELSKNFSSPDSKRFVNGILDKVKAGLQRPLRSAEDPNS